MVEPLKVYTVAGAETLVPWLGADVAVAHRVNELPRAELGVTLAEGFAVNAGTVTPLPALVNDGDVYRVRTARGGDPEDEDVLFDGRIERVGYGVSAQGRRATLRLTHLADVLRHDPRYHVRGQLWIPKRDVEELSATPPGVPLSAVVPIEVPALDCVFNPHGERNCSRWILEPTPAEGTGDGRLPVFTSARDAAARWWSWARVLLYLLAWARLTQVGEAPRLGEWTSHGFRELPGADGMTLTERILGDDWQTVEPDASSIPEEPWPRVFTGRPNSHSIEGLDWLSAWKYTCARCGLIWAWEPVYVAELGWRWGLRVEHPEALQATSVRLPTRAWKSGDHPWAETTDQAANIAALDIEADYGLVNSIGASGAPDRREVTVELVPGWPAQASWDVNPAHGEAVEAAVAALETEAWAQRFCLGGASFNPVSGGADWNIGRLWGLNTHGAWSGYGRDWAPWKKPDPPPGTDPGAYKLFDLADVRLATPEPESEYPYEFIAGASAVRPRRFGNGLTGLVARMPLPPIVELSFDEGQHWRLTTAGAQVSTWDLRVYFETPDLRSEIQAVAEWPNPGMSFPEAYIRGLLRVRITATIDTDTRMGYAALALSEHTLSRRTRHRVLQRPGSWAMARRDDYGDPLIAMGNSLFNRSLYPAAPNRPVAGFRDDYAVAERDVYMLLRSTDRVAWRGSAEIPWLEYPRLDIAGQIVSGYRAGDALVALDCEEGAEPEAHPEYYRLPLAASAESEEAGALIGEVVWSYSQDPPACSTRINLEDRSRLVSFGGVQ